MTSGFLACKRRAKTHQKFGDAPELATRIPGIQRQNRFGVRRGPLRTANRGNVSPDGVMLPREVEKNKQNGGDDAVDEASIL